MRNGFGLTTRFSCNRPQTFFAYSIVKRLLPTFLSSESSPMAEDASSNAFLDDSSPDGAAEAPGGDTEERPDYEISEDEQQGLCRAFALLDKDGDGVIDPADLEQLLISWGRMPMDFELCDIMSHAKGTGCEGATGMDYEGFRRYITKQLVDTKDEEELRNAFKVFDSDPPTGLINLAELRHSLKHEGVKLTDDEIDFLYREEDYWMLEEKNMFQYEELISKILDKPYTDAFLHC